MTQPKFAPIGIEDEVRPAYKLDVPRPWTPHRPAEFDARHRDGDGGAGPDQGYLTLLARRFVDKIVLGNGEHLDDVAAAAIGIGMARASSIGRAPVAKDLEYALILLGSLSGAPSARIEGRAELVGGVAHDEWRLRSLVAMVSPEMLRMTPEEASETFWNNRTKR